MEQGQRKQSRQRGIAPAARACDGGDADVLVVQERLLSEASALLAEASEVGPALARLAELAARLPAEVCTVYDLDEHDRARLRAVAHAAPDGGGRIRALPALGPSLTDAGPLLRVLHAGEALLYPVLDPENAPCGLPPEALRPASSGSPPPSALFVPVIGGGRVLAALACVSTRRRLHDGDLRAAAELARLAGRALAKASLVEAEKRSRTNAERAAERLGRVQEVMSALSNELSRDRIAELTLEEGARALKARAGGLWALGPDSQALSLHRALGLAQSGRPEPTHVPIDVATPLGRALLDRTPVWIERREDLDASFPSVSTDLFCLEPDASLALVCIPLIVEERPLGALSFCFDGPHRFDDEERRFLAVLAQSCADALERARLFEAERRACARAEGVAMRLAHLNAVMAELARATTVEAIGDVVMEDGVAACGAASGAFFVLADDDRRLRRVRVVGADSVPESLELDTESPVGTALQTRSPVWLSSREELRARFPRAAQGLRWLGADDVERLVCVPLLVDGVPRGAVLFGFRFGVGFDADERLFVELLVKTCSHALERALLLEDERRAKADLQDAKQRLEVVIRSSPAAIMLLELDGTVRLWNPAAEQIFGWSAPDVVGRPMPSVPDDRRAELLEVLARVGRGEQALGIETRRVTKDGRPIDISLWAAPVRHSQGVQCLSVVADITEKKQAEEVRREAEARFRRIFESSMMGIGVWDIDGVIHDANDGLLRMLGYERDDLAAGQVTWRGITSPGEGRRDELALVEMRERGVCAPYEKTYVRKDGSTLPALVGSATWEGSRDAGVFFAIDISEQKRAEARQRFLAEASRILTGSLDYEVTVEQLVDLVVPRFADWCFVHLHDADSDTIERVALACHDPRCEDGFRSFPSRLPHDGQYLASRVIASARPEMRVGLDADAWRRVAKTPDHERKLRAINPRSYIGVPLIARGVPIGALTLSSSRHDYDDTDLELAVELASRASLAIDNARLYRDAQTAIQTREEFLSVASHELKTPLNSLQLHVQMLLRAFERETGGPSREMLHRSLGAVQRQVERQTKLINELLDVSRAGLGRLTLSPEPVAFDELVREVVARFDVELERTGTELHVHAEPGVVGAWDRSRLDQVVTNLVSNAVKYGAGKPVEVRVERRGEIARLVVKDRGIGIAPEHKSRIFDRFARAVSERHYGGFGLGLWITRQIVEASGGAIAVDSDPDTGSAFTVHLPLQGATR